MQARQQTITPNYNYHIVITTNQGAFVYTNLYAASVASPPTITQVQDRKVITFGVLWPKQPDVLVQAVDISLFFDFTLNGVSYFGSSQAHARGYDLAEVSLAGQLESVQGPGKTNMTQASLALLNYQMAQFAQSAQSSSAYLRYDYSVLPINMPTDVFEAEMTLNYGGLIAYQSAPSITGQLVWSWVQYCPLFLAFYWLLDIVFAFLVREKVIKRTVTHDPEYMKLVTEQNDRKTRLRLN